MLDLINLDFDYQDEPLLSHISFHVPEGGLLYLKGANGAGKTTLLKLIAGLYLPIQGQIQFYGQSIHRDLSSYQQQLCFLSHKAGINPYLTVKENCLFDIHYPTQGINSTELLSIFKLDADLDTPCGLLSAGQRRQVALLRLWMTQAKLWLLDEPLIALDAQAIPILMDKIAEHRAKGGGVIMTSHQDLPLESSIYQEYSL